MKINTKVLCALSALYLIKTSLLLAQDRPIEGHTYAPEHIKTILEKHSVDSAKDKSVVPESVYYRYILEEIIWNPNDIFFDGDFALIKTLPSHSNSQFTTANYQALANVCEDIKNVASVEGVIELAQRVDSARDAQEKLLLDHYQSFVRKLSGSAQGYIEEKKIEMANSDDVGYGSLNLAGFATDLPDLALEVMKNGCVEMPILKASIAKSAAARMIDEVRNIAPMQMDYDVRD